MGDPKKLKKKYNMPAHPWKRAEIEESRQLRKEYGLKNRREVLIANSFLKKYKDLAKKLISTKTVQNDKEKEQIYNKLLKLGLLPASSDLEQVLALNVKDIMERRLQSLVYRKGLAKSMNQARQFITHRHIGIGEKEITSPSYLTTLEEESTITFKENSALSDAEHPERIVVSKVKEEKQEKTKKNEEEEKEVLPVEELEAIGEVE